jgi:hypothetical protein
VLEGALDVGDALEDAVEEDDFRPVSLSQIDILRDVGRQEGLTWLVIRALVDPDDDKIKNRRNETRGILSHGQGPHDHVLRAPCRFSASSSKPCPQLPQPTQSLWRFFFDM